MAIIKTMVIGDVHGSKWWKKHIERIDEFDRVVIMGDYFDDWKNDWVEANQIDNLQEIIDWKKKYPNKITTLIGNHCFGYIANERMSGQQEYKFFDIKEFLEKNIDEFVVGCKIGEWVFSHAGISKYWMKKYGFTTLEEVNEAFAMRNYEPFKFYRGSADSYGNDVLNSPLWIRPEALTFSAFFNKQVVGHSASDRMETNHLVFKDENGKQQEIYIVDKNDHSAYMEMDIEV